LVFINACESAELSALLYDGFDTQVKPALALDS
jgi:hypothetical protein